MSNPYYSEIKKLNGLADIKNIVEKWNVLSKNIKSTPAGLPILLPEMLWVSKSGVGKTHLLKLISEYLYNQKNLMEFYGTVKFFEFLMGYCSPNTEFTELRRFIDAVQQSAGFRSEFKGIVCIDIDEWIGHEEEKHFLTLLEYLSSNSDTWMIVFWISPQKEADAHNIEHILSMFFRLDKATIELPETTELIKFVKQQLKEYELFFDGDAEKIITRTIEVLRENKYFDGYKTLAMLCQDIAYSVFTSKQSEAVVSNTVASLFSEDSDYIKRTIQKIEKKNVIGFGRG